jgi:hypothetical protein
LVELLVRGHELRSQPPRLGARWALCEMIDDLETFIEGQL